MLINEDFISQIQSKDKRKKCIKQIYRIWTKAIKCWF